MSYKYGHRGTSLNGVWLYIQQKYPDSHIVLSAKISRNKIDLTGLNDFMIEFLKSIDEKYYKSVDRNAIEVQKKFNQFTLYCKQNLNTTEES